ncbi:hypothetical protein, partial [Xanthovirga aplysinae]|uniref:hypothetical protein n=1 Tax=Xanthovirga aplysinae TaxID=2529853 RepID=UPI001656C23C
LDTPIVLPNRNVLFGFDSDIDEEPKNELLKIYIRREAYDPNLLNKGKHKTTLYNNSYTQ